MTDAVKRHATFGSRNKKATKEPVTFDLEGVTLDDVEFSEKFTARANLPGMEIINFAKKGTQGAGVVAIEEMFEEAFEDEERERFLAFVKDKNNNVPLEDLTAIVGHLVEQYTSRPTQAS